MLAKAERLTNFSSPAPPGHSTQHKLDAIHLHRPSTALWMHQRTLRYHKHLQIDADCGPNLSSTSGSEADSSLHNAVSTLALLDLLLAQTPPAAPDSDSSVSLQPETAELSMSPTETVHAPEVDTSPSKTNLAQSAGASAQLTSCTSAQISTSTPAQTSASISSETPAGTSAQTSAGTFAQTSEGIWAQAWQPLEAGQAAQAQAKHAQQAKTNSSAAHANVRSTSLPSLRFWRQQQTSDDDTHADKQQQKLHHNSGQSTFCCSCSCQQTKFAMHPPLYSSPAASLPPIIISGSSRTSMLYFLFCISILYRFYIYTIYFLIFHQALVA